jgi:hypothetical protein
MANETKIPLTVYGRMQKVRAELAKLNLKKSGKNKFTQNVYYELGDFVPALNRLMDEQGITTRFTLEKEKAVLIVFNSDKPEDKEVFFIPVAASEVKGATAIQNLGAQITYLRRYLLMIAFEIAEGDTEDAQVQEEIKQIEQKYVDQLNAVKTLTELAKVSKTIQEKLGADYRKSLVAEYTRRKGEIESAESENLVDDVDAGLKKEGK